MTYVSTTPIGGYLPELLYIVNPDNSVGICAVPNLTNIGADVASTINSASQTTVFNATGLSDSPPVANVGQAIVKTGAPGSAGTAADLLRTAHGTVAGTSCTINNPA
jgi:hypothetical protein